MARGDAKGKAVGRSGTCGSKLPVLRSEVSSMDQDGVAVRLMATFPAESAGCENLLLTAVLKQRFRCPTTGDCGDGRLFDGEATNIYKHPPRIDILLASNPTTYNSASS